MAKKNTPSSKSKVAWVFPWENRNFVGIGIGIGVILTGFALLLVGTMTTWDNPLSVSVAPVVLVIGYCVILPWAIMRGGTPKE